MAIDLVTGGQYGISRWNIPARLPIICDAHQFGLKQSGDLGGLGVESETTAHVLSLRELPESLAGAWSLAATAADLVVGALRAANVAPNYGCTTA